jgi:hypothetical protein
MFFYDVVHVLTLTPCFYKFGGPLCAGPAFLKHIRVIGLTLT